MTVAGVITIGIDPEIHLGPIGLGWHSVTIVVGIVVGGWVGGRWASRRGLGTDPLYTMCALAGVGGLVGGRLFYLLEHGGPLLSSRGYTFDGGLILATLLIAAYVKVARLSARYFDAGAVGLPLGVAIGRIGDVINGEHYGGRSDSLLAVRNSHPDALTPNSDYAYHNGGLYEVLLALVIFAIVWSLRERLRRPGELAWLVLGLFAAGRFLEFFARSDSPQLALGLDNAQWTSIGLLIVVVAGWAATTRRLEGQGDPAEGSSSPVGPGGT